MNNHIYLKDTTDIANIGYITGCVTQSVIRPDRIAMDELREVLFTEKKVVLQKPKTIDQMVASALSILHMSIEAEASWASEQIKKDFRSSRSPYIFYGVTEDKIEELFDLAVSNVK